MASQRGSSLDPNDGITVYCPHRNCEAQEISGHGTTEAAAYKVVMSRRLKSENIKPE
jgi:hypothetical protein